MEKFTMTRAGKQAKTKKAQFFSNYYYSTTMLTDDWPENVGAGC